MRHPKLAGAAFVCAIAAAVVAVQPVGAPWWVNADPDGAYLGSGVNLLAGNHTVYLDHPGLANEEAFAFLFGGKYVAERIAGNSEGLTAFADRQLLHLDASRPLYRGLAIAFFVSGALLSYLCVSRLLGDRRWGLAAGVLFAAAPAVGPISFLTRPDVTAATAAIAVACLTATAFQRRSAGHYLGAALLLGFALTTKLVVVGLLVPLLLAALWREPEPGWRPRTLRAARVRLEGRRAAVGALVTGWIALCVAFNWSRPPLVVTSDQRHLLAGAVAILGGYATLALASSRYGIPVARRLFRPFLAAAAGALVVGVALPTTLAIDDGPATAQSIWETATGRGLNASIEPFASFSGASLGHYPLLGTLLMVACACVAGAVGVLRRVYWPLILALGSIVLAVEAAARLGVPYYYACAYAVAIPGSLWLLASQRRLGALAATALCAYLLLGALTNPARDPARDVRWNRDAQRLADRLLRPGEVILTPYRSTWPIEDLRYDGFVVQFTVHAPTWPYRFVEGGSPQLEQTRKRVAYYAASVPDAANAARAGFVLVGDRRYTVRGPLLRWGGDLDLAVVRVVGASGV